MEKQYSVQFFTNFVENLQNLCHGYLDFEQSVEVSGYLCVEIDNIKKERFVLSEIIQSNGRSISESYCTKVFKSSPSSMVQRNNFKDITNHSQDQAVQDNSFPQRLPANQRPRFGQNIISPSSSRSSMLSQQGNDRLQKNPYTQISEFRNVNSMGPQRSFSLSENRTKGFDEESKLNLSRINQTSLEVTDKAAERQLSDSESADDGDIIIVKTEPKTSDSGEPPPDDEKGETLRLPESLLSGGRQSTSLDEDFSDSMQHVDFNTSDYDLQMNLYPPTSTSTFSPGLSINTLTIFNNIRPVPYVVDTPEGKRITCLLCRNVAWSETDFVMHMKVHPSCKECGRFLVSHMDLRSHMQKEHGRTSMFKCSFCDKVFLSKGGMMEHQRLKHEKTAPRFVCVICRHVCVRKRHLEDHLENVHKKKSKDTLDIS